MSNKTILPSQKYLQECFTYDQEIGKLFWKTRPINHFKDKRSWRIFNSVYSGKEALTTKTKRGYFQGKISGKMYLAHRVIWKLVYGTEPEEILHEKGRTGDNRIEKLSSDSHIVNMKDMKKSLSNNSGITGVGWYKPKSKWRVRINAFNKPKHLGYFEDFFEACCIRKSAEIKEGYHLDHGRDIEYKNSN